MVGRYREFQLLQLTNETRDELRQSCALDNDWLLALSEMQGRVDQRRSEDAAQRQEKKRKFFGR